MSLDNIPPARMHRLSEGQFVLVNSSNVMIRIKDNVFAVSKAFLFDSGRKGGFVTKPAGGTCASLPKADDLKAESRKKSSLKTATFYTEGVKILFDLEETNNSKGCSGPFRESSAGGALISTTDGLQLEQFRKDGSVSLFVDQIARSRRASEVAALYGQMPALVRDLMAKETCTRVLSRFIAIVSGAIIKKVMQLTLNKLGSPPTRFVFLTMGSEARLEQTLKTDQDNAILYEDVTSSGEVVQSYFLKFGEIACGLLNQVGYAHCTGGLMAMNPKWCQPLNAWKKYFSNWIHCTGPEDLLHASIFFDFRGAYGDKHLASGLRDHLFEELDRWPGFFPHLIENALYFKPPSGKFATFTLTPKRACRNSLNIKSAMSPIVDFTRVYALKHGVRETNTWERIRQLRLKRVLTHKEAEELERAYSALMRLRLMCQVTAGTEDEPKPDNCINPRSITSIDQAMLKEILRQARKFQIKMKYDFTGGCPVTCI